MLATVTCLLWSYILFFFCLLSLFSLLVLRQDNKTWLMVNVGVTSRGISMWPLLFHTKLLSH